MTNYDRRTFIKQFGLVAGFLTLSGSSGLIFAGNNKKRPLEMLALGDSIVWGQGLKLENKFSYLVSKWLEAKTGREIRFHHEAHSGATIYPESDKKKKYKKYGALVMGGEEINVSMPSIFQQLSDSVEFYKNRNDPKGGKLSPDSVDLILIDGGINDVQAANIVLSSEKKIRKRAEKYCYRGMKQLLAKVVDTYPNARIVVTGYFPLISLDTNKTEILDGILMLTGENGVQRELSKFANKILKMVPKEWQQFHKTLASRSDTWYGESKRNLNQAVVEINQEKKSAAFSPTNPRIFFAAPIFESKHAYGVDGTTFLWRIRAKSKTDDELFEARKKICDEIASLREPICHRAAAFHPNIKGAQEYADRIKEKLEPILDSTGWKKT